MPNEASIFENLKRVTTSSGSTITYYSRDLNASSNQRPILVLIHGYPQSFRRIVPLLPANVPLFIPDIPGYGDSTPSASAHDKLTIGDIILEGLERALPKQRIEQTTEIIIAGHDRGARICQRLATEALDINSFKIVSAVILDIVPTLLQWRSFDSPAGMVGKFHWTFLANVDIATELITSNGGGWWCKELITRWAGKNSDRLDGIMDEKVLKVYMNHFEKETVVRASCEDYRSGAFEDVVMDLKDEKAGRKIEIPTLVIFSEAFTGSIYDVPRAWRDYVALETKLQVEGIGDGVGHFIAEEAPEEVAQIMSKWVQQFTK